jgi:DNA-binding transcriptional regulator YiaG
MTRITARLSRSPIRPTCITPSAYTSRPSRTRCVGDELRFLRKQMDLTQEALAQRLRVNVQTVANYEKGKTAKIGPSEQIVRVLYVLHVLPHDMPADHLRAALEAMTTQRPVPPLPEPMRRKVMGHWYDDTCLIAA